MRDLLLQHVGSTFLTTHQTWTPCVGSVESKPLDNQGSPHNFLEQWSLPRWWTLPFMISLYHFTYSKTFRIGVSPLKPCCCLTSWVYVMFSILCCRFNSLHSGSSTRSRLHFRKPLIVPLQEVASPFGSCVGLRQFNPVLRLRICFQSSCCSCHICRSFLHWNLEPPQSHLWVLKSTSSKLLLVLIIWTSSCEPQMVSRMVNLFQKVFGFLSPDPLEESLSVSAVALWNAFLKYWDLKLEIAPWSMGCMMVLLLAGTKTLISLSISIRALGWPGVWSVSNNVLKGLFPE